MSASQPVERVVELLSANDYDPLPDPVVVSGITFDFPAMLVGRSSLDLIAVLDTLTDNDDDDVARRVERLSRALDLVESRRPLTVVLVGPEPAPALQRALAGVARVLLAAAPSGEEQLREALAVLLPLDLSRVTEMPDSWRTARDHLEANYADAAAVLDAAKEGADAVAEAARAFVIGAGTDAEERG